MVPDPNKNDPQDVIALQEADKSIGDYKLRTDPMYVQTDDEQSSVSYKFRELLRIREELCSVRKDYNTKVFALRNAKKALVTYVHEQLEVLLHIHTELPKDSRKFPQTIPKIDEQLEYPDKLLKVCYINFNSKYLLMFSYLLFSLKSRPRTVLRPLRNHLNFY